LLAVRTATSDRRLDGEGQALVLEPGGVVDEQAGGLGLGRADPAHVGAGARLGHRDIRQQQLDGLLVADRPPEGLPLLRVREGGLHRSSAVPPPTGPCPPHAATASSAVAEGSGCEHPCPEGHVGGGEVESCASNRGAIDAAIDCVTNCKERPN
jgi:hypothetical protein